MEENELQDAADVEDIDKPFEAGDFAIVQNLQAEAVQKYNSARCELTEFNEDLQRWQVRMEIDGQILALKE